jgi:hypothetical protein
MEEGGREGEGVGGYSFTCTDVRKALNARGKTLEKMMHCAKF